MAICSLPQPCSDSPNGMETLAGSVPKMEGDHLNIKTVAALFVVTPKYYLNVGLYDLKHINLRCTPQGCQHKKDNLDTLKVTDSFKYVKVFKPLKITGYVLCKMTDRHFEDDWPLYYN